MAGGGGVGGREAVDLLRVAEAMADVEECELTREATEAEAVELAEQVVKQCGDQCRGSWAREWLRKRKGGV